MSDFDLPLKFILAFILGGVIGLEREINEKKNIEGDKNGKQIAILGLRSFSLIAGLGLISGLLLLSQPIFSYLIFGLFGVIIAGYYFIDSKSTNDYGITTELAAVYSFLTGFLLTVKDFPVQIVLALTIIVVLLLSRKEKIKAVVEEIKTREIDAFISYAILALVILPFLPNSTYALSDIPGAGNLLGQFNISGKILELELFNPFKLWMIAVLITGVDLFGYILERTVGAKKGWLLTSLAGGFVSSTATTVSLAKESKGSSNVNLLVASALFANSISFVPAMLLIISTNGQFFASVVLLLLSLLLSTLVLGIYFLYISGKNKQSKTKLKEDGHKIFDLGAALKFVGLFLAVNIISKIALEIFGEGGFLATSAIGALPGIDAVVINTAQLAGGKINFEVATWALVIINAVNLLAKSVYSFMQGSKEFAVKFLICMSVVIALSVVVNLF